MIMPEEEIRKLAMAMPKTVMPDMVRQGKTIAREEQ
jgi:hypothetical protein